MTPVLTVEGLSLDYRTQNRTVRALENIAFTIAAGETLGIVGESGSGKSTLAYAIARYLPENAHITQGPISVLGANIWAADAAELRQIRRNQIGMVYQNSSAALNPTKRIGQQLIETIVLTGTPRAEASSRALALLNEVRIADPASMLKRFPHQASGGELQRILIAMAIAGTPKLLILDEPTTALDPETQSGILELIGALKHRLGAGMIFISHDLDTVSSVTDRVLILKGGHVVESGPTAQVLTHPQHDYTSLLLASRPGEIAETSPVAMTRAAKQEQPNRTLLSMRNFGVTYSRSGLFSAFQHTKEPDHAALRGVNLDIAAGKTLAVVGRSGSGKSTLAKGLMGLLPFTGDICINNRVYNAPRDLDADYRRAVQIVFQNPDTSLNPRHRISEILARPLHRLGSDSGSAAIAALLDQVQLPASFAARFPHQLSGGQRQRVAIARALAARPELMICDEITSALDVTTQASIIELLVALQAEQGTAFLFISHDLALVRSFADATVLVDAGEVRPQTTSFS